MTVRYTTAIIDEDIEKPREIEPCRNEIEVANDDQQHRISNANLVMKKSKHLLNYHDGNYYTKRDWRSIFVWLIFVVVCAPVTYSWNCNIDELPIRYPALLGKWVAMNEECEVLYKVNKAKSFELVEWSNKHKHIPHTIVMLPDPDGTLYESEPPWKCPYNITFLHVSAVDEGHNYLEMLHAEENDLLLPFSVGQLMGLGIGGGEISYELGKYGDYFRRSFDIVVNGTVLKDYPVAWMEDDTMGNWVLLGNQDAGYNMFDITVRVSKQVMELSYVGKQLARRRKANTKHKCRRSN